SMPHSDLDRQPYAYKRLPRPRVTGDLQRRERNVPRPARVMPQVGDEQPRGDEQAALAREQAHVGPAVVVERRLVQPLGGGVRVAAVRAEQAGGAVGAAQVEQPAEDPVGVVVLVRAHRREGHGDAGGEPLAVMRCPAPRPPITTSWRSRTSGGCSMGPSSWTRQAVVPDPRSTSSTSPLTLATSTPEASGVGPAVAVISRANERAAEG